MAPLYLVGTCHIDPKGPERLGKFFRYVQPDVMTLEIDKDRAVSFRQHHAYAALSFLQNESRYRASFGDAFFYVFKGVFLAYGYEVWASEEYAREHPGVRCSFVDNRDASKIIKDSLFEGGEDFLKELMSSFSLNHNTPFQEWIDDVYKDRAHFLETLRTRDPSLFQEVTYTGDVSMESGIRAAYSTVEYACVHVGGVGHIISDYYNLYDRLQDLHPIRVALPEMDRFP